MSHITDTTYAVKYYWRSINERGEQITLYIKAKGYRGAPLAYRICDLAGLRLQIQGDQDGIDSPIVKTSLQIALIDSYDAEDKAIGYETVDGQSKYVYEKHGNWSEFFTPDATKYLVEVYMEPNSESEWPSSRLVWAGYLTPDSWQESLDYRNQIVLTARDNLGHLADYDFDLTPDDNGLVSVYDILDKALDKIAFPMGCSTHFDETGDRAALLAQDADSPSDLTPLGLYVCASALEDKTWYEALEETLNSIGAVLRFEDYGYFLCAPLRYLPDGGNENDSDPPLIFPTMEFYGGNRILDPACKEILEKIDFGFDAEVKADELYTKKDSVTITTSNTSFVLEGNETVVDPYGEQSVEQYAISGPEVYQTGGSGTIQQGPLRMIGGGGMIDDRNYAIQDYTAENEGEGFRNYLFFPCNRGSISGRTVNYDMNTTVLSLYARVKSSQLKLAVEFAENPAGFDDNGKLGSYPFKLWKLAYQIYYRKQFGSSSTTYYWTGTTWTTYNYTINKEFDVTSESVNSLEEELAACDAIGEYGYLFLSIKGMVYRTRSYYFTSNALVWLMSYGVYARLKTVTLTSTAGRVMKTDSITTINNSSYNVRLSRSPLFGCSPQTVGFVCPDNYKHAFFYYDSNDNPQLAPYNWKWTDRDTALPFPSQIHLQLLAYHATPLERLEGACGIQNKVNRLTFDDNYEYKGLAHLIVSGTYNFMTARFESASLRSYVNFGSVSVRTSANASTTTQQSLSSNTSVSTVKQSILSATAVAEAPETIEEELQPEEETEVLTPTLELAVATEVAGTISSATVERVILEDAVAAEE